MENDNKKIITVSFVVTAFIVYLVTRVLFQFLAINVGFFGKLWSEVSLQHGIPVAVALITFVVLEFNKTIQAWADECVTEVKKVVWPSRKDTTAMTVVTCIMVLISGGILGLFDFVSTQVVKMFINL